MKDCFESVDMDNILSFSRENYTQNYEGNYEYHAN